VVNLVEKWTVLKENAGDKLGFYQILCVEGKREIRVSTGKLGFKKQFEANDQELTEIEGFCKNRFIEISGNIRDEFFFK
jgi:hypothetical protein